MLLSEHKELKSAIRSLPEREKDKLLLRLVAKDGVLTEHLHFTLLEDENDLALRCESLTLLIRGDVEKLLAQKKSMAKDTLLVMRRLMGKINHHFKVTKDASSDVELRILLLKLIPVGFTGSVFSSAHKFNERLNLYFVKSTVAVMNKYRKMHEDLQFDLKGLMNDVLEKIYNNETAAAAKAFDLPKEL